MAIFNEILSGRFNRALQKITGIKGSPPVPQLAGEITASLPMFWGRECRYLESWETFFAAIQQNALAAANSAVRFRNPSTSNVIVVLEKLQFWTSVADPQGVMLRNGALGTDLTNVVALLGARMDARGRPNATTIVSEQNTAVVAGGNPAIIPTAANTPVDYILTDIQEVVLLPGDRLDVITQVANTILTVNVMWRERFLEDSERS